MSHIDITVYPLGPRTTTIEGVKGRRIDGDPALIRWAGVWVEHPSTRGPVIVPAIGCDEDGWPVVQDPCPEPARPTRSRMIRPHMMIVRGG